MKTKLLFFGLLLIAGCSKKDPEPEFFVSATVDGKQWTANVVNDKNTNVGASIVQNSMFVIAAQTVDNTTTGLAIAFPKTTVAGTTLTPSLPQFSAVFYTISNTEGYVIDASKGVTGTLTVSRYDEAAGIVEGTFSGEAQHTRNSSRVKIENGRFRSAIYATPPATPPPGKK